MNAYPLSWPEGWPRTEPPFRDRAKFNKRDSSGSSIGYAYKRDITVADAVSRVFDEIRAFTKAGRAWRIDPSDVVISTNMRARNDGLPRPGEREPSDPGVAVYWIEGGKRRVMAIDQYTTVAGNLAAIAATLDAMRAIERHGGARILERAFTGFTALPAPGTGGWRQVMGLDAAEKDLARVRAAYRRLAAERHPDRSSGSHNGMAELNAAMSAAERELTACAD